MNTQTEAQRLATALDNGTYLLSVERSATSFELNRLDAENAKLTEQRDALLEACIAAVECRMVPFSSAREGGAVAYAKQAQVADMIRDAIAKATGETA
jgi:hypothetical protein